MNELEKKLLLTKDEYTFLLDRFRNNSSIVKQINYYFDDEKLSMNSQNITCRIRLKDGKYKGTMKKHTSTDRSTENKIKVRDGIYNNAFIDMGLKLQGELITERCIILKDSSCEVALDKNEYLDHIDYEMEIEYAPSHEKAAQSILQNFFDILMRRNGLLSYSSSCTQTPHVPSKSNRFFKVKAAIDSKS